MRLSTRRGHWIAAFSLSRQLFQTTGPAPTFRGTRLLPRCLSQFGRAIVSPAAMLRLKIQELMSRPWTSLGRHRALIRVPGFSSHIRAAVGSETLLRPLFSYPERLHVIRVQRGI